ncbi:MAG: hypothetical protein LUQ71_08695 [Methanoregula sp.]|nr:hypothetical protein [Methanoregula sp.]
MTYMPKCALPFCMVLLVLGWFGPCPGAASSPDAPFITIDPIGNHTYIEQFFINGTTNLAVSNESLLLRIGSAEFNPGGFGSSFYTLNVSITRGEHGVNTWSAEIMPSRWEVYSEPPGHYPTPSSAPAMPGRYQVVISSLNPYGQDVVAMQYFTVMSTVSGNTSGTITTGDPFAVATGATEIPSRSPTVPSTPSMAVSLIALGACGIMVTVLRRRR